MLRRALRRLIKPRRVTVAKKRIATRDELDNQVREFEDWRRKNPGRPARDWYSEQRMQAQLRGETHSTIGGNLRGGEFEKVGRDEFQELVNHGLQPSHLCVDFGCGTLRVGQHVIRYLAPGAYWGLDIAEHLLDTGRSLIGSDLIAEKKPNLRVISSDSVAEAASKRPQMLFSLKVMQHIHPEELCEYLENVVKIIGPSGRALIFSKWSDSDTKQYATMGWAHAFATVEGAITNLGARVSILQAKRKSLPFGAGDYMKGTLEIAQV